MSGRLNCQAAINLNICLLSVCAESARTINDDSGIKINWKKSATSVYMLRVNLWLAFAIILSAIVIGRLSLSEFEPSDIK